MAHREEEHPDQQEILSEQELYLCYGRLGRESYAQYAQDMIEEKFGPTGKEEDKQERLKMWANYENLWKQIEDLPADYPGSVLEYIEDFVKGLNKFAEKQMTERPKDGLGAHLAEATHAAQGLLLTPGDVEARMPEIISYHDSRLFVYVMAPLHDLIKFLGTTNAQIMPDHEVMTAELVAKLFTGRKVKLGDEQRVYQWEYGDDDTLSSFSAYAADIEYGTGLPVEDGERDFYPGDMVTLTEEDVYKIALPISNHENILKELGRSEFIYSDDPAVREIAVFFLIDVLGAGTYVSGSYTDELGREKSVIRGEKALLISRWKDLFFRHLDSVEAKISRPTWAYYAIKDIVSTLVGIERSGSMVFSLVPEKDEVLPIMLIEMCIKAIDELILADRCHKDLNRFLSTNNIAAIERLNYRLEHDENSVHLRQFKTIVKNILLAHKENGSVDLTKFVVPVLSEEQLCDSFEVGSQLFIMKELVGSYVDVQRSILEFAQEYKYFESSENVSSNRIGALAQRCVYSQFSHLWDVDMIADLQTIEANPKISDKEKLLKIVLLCIDKLKAVPLNLDFE